MRVVHFIPKSQNVGATASYVELLVSAMDKFAKPTLTTSITQLRKTTKPSAPDIIHIHGCWSIYVATAARWAEQQGLPVVISLHGALQPWQWRPATNLTNDMRRYAFLEKAVRRADAIHVEGEMEMQRMRQLAWNPRVAIVRNALVTNRISTSSMAAQMTQLYQKVIDSNTFRLMTDEEKQAESILLRTALDYENTRRFSPSTLAWSPNDQTTNPQNVQALEADSWRKILIHASDEHILDYIQQAADLLMLNIAHINTDDVDRFPQKLQKPDGTLPVDHLLARHALKTKSKLDHLRQDEKPSDTEMAICHLFLNVQHQLRHTALSRRHIAQLFAIIRYSDYNEDKLSRMLRHLKLTPFASRILQILHDTLALEEGFMPIEPRDDKGTTAIRQALQALNIQA
ncbi:MAG: glycosyltransferase [Prevotella sp.]|nr:glycosyltransferase [Prevotella sp.]